MDDHGKTGKEFDPQQIFKPLLILLLTALFVQQLPLGGKRPAADKERTPAAGIKVDARLWADPLDAPRRDSKSGETHATNLGDFGGQIAGHILGSEKGSRVVFLGVMVDGGPYSESVEMRRRTRYAVISGLSVSGYEPEDPEHIRYLQFPDPFRLFDPWQKRVLSRGERQFTDLLPYEWFRPARHGGKPVSSDLPGVVVLWLDQNGLSDRPLEKLGVLYNQLRFYPLRSVYRCPYPENDAAGNGSCRLSNRPTLLEEELNRLLAAPDLRQRFERLVTNDGGGADDKGIAMLQTLWNELEIFRKSDRPVELSTYLHFLPLAQYLDLSLDAGHGQNPDITRITAVADRLIDSPGMAAGSGTPIGRVRCDIPNDSFLFQLLGHRSTDFLDALAEHLGNAVTREPKCAYASQRDRPDMLTPLFDRSLYDFAVLGPASSDLLAAMIQDLRYIPGGADAEARNRYFPFRFFSPVASADEPSLIKATGIPEDAHRLSALFSQHGISFQRVTVSDDRLAATIRAELDLRGVPAASLRNPIVLISEWDNTYAQKLRTTFCEKLYPDVGENTPGYSGTGPLGLCKDYSYSYLRGLDGEGAPKPKRFEDETSDGGKNKSMSLDKAMAPASASDNPWGDDQVDYLNRIAEDIALNDRRLRDDSPPGAIRAIGLLGSDVYDKLMILRALRKHFPDVLFFTTDLDARLLDNSGNDTLSRNLVVASSFGLQLRPKLQKDIPPFRGSYQTAYFLATQMALVDAPWDQQVLDDCWLQPRLFEVGRSRFVPLVQAPPAACTEPKGSAGLPPQGHAASRVGQIRCPDVGECFKHRAPIALSARHETLSLIPMMIRIGALLAIAVLTRATWRGAGFGRFEADDGDRPPVGIGLARLAAIACCAFFLLLLYGIASFSEEPLEWLQGVSIWPTEFIRLTALLAVAFYFWPRSLSWLENYRRDLQLSGLIELPAKPWPTPSAVDCFRSRRFWLVMTALSASLLLVQWILDLDQVDPLALLVVPGLLTGYALGENLRNRLWASTPVVRSSAEQLSGALHEWFVDERHDRRVVVFMLCFMGVTLGLMLVFGTPVVPYRGDPGKWTDRIVLDALVVAFQGLTALVVEAVRLSCTYLRNLEQTAIFGNADRYAKRWGVPDGLAQPWMKIQLAGLLTKHANRLISYPFIVATLMALARMRIFDNWSFPLGLAILFLLSFGFLLVAAWTMRLEAKALQARELAALAERARALKRDADAQPMAEIREMIDAITGFREGAYASLLQRPVFQGLLLLVTGGSAEFILPLIVSLF